MRAVVAGNEVFFSKEDSECARSTERSTRTDALILARAFCVPGQAKESCHEEDQRTVPVSRSRVSGARATRPKPGCSAAIASCTAAKSCSNGSAGRIPARAGPPAGFKNCCMLTGEFDGSDRDEFYRY